MWSEEYIVANSLETHHIFPVIILSITKYNLSANSGLLLEGMFTAEENEVREKYGKLVQNPPLYTGHDYPEQGLYHLLAEDQLVTDS